MALLCTPCRAPRATPRHVSAACVPRPAGVPYSDVNLRTGEASPPSWGHVSSLSEMSSVSLEFTYLSRQAPPDLVEIELTTACQEFSAALLPIVGHRPSLCLWAAWLEGDLCPGATPNPAGPPSPIRTLPHPAALLLAPAAGSPGTAPLRRSR